MTNQDLQSYKRLGIPLPKKRKRTIDFGVFELLEYIFSFLLSRTVMLSGMSPFGIAFFAAVFPKQKRLPVVLAVLLGLASSNMGLRIMQYAGAMVIVCTFFILLEQEFSGHSWMYATVAASAVCLTGFVFIAFNGFLMYDVLLQILEGILVFFSFFAFQKATEVLRSIKNRTVFEPAESLCLLFLCAGVVLSLGNLPYFQGAAHVLSLVIILVAGLAGGFSLSGPAGLLLGVVNSLNDVLPAQVVAVYAVSAFCSGLLQKKGRWGVTLGFFIANAAAMLYFNSSANSIISLYHIILAGTVLFLLPDRLLAVFGEAVKSPVYAEDSVARLRDIMSDKLSAASQSFEALAETFNEAIEQHVDTEIRDPAFLFDKTADEICRNCSLMRYCWQKEYNETKRSMMTLYRRMEQRGTVATDDVPESFKKECIRLEDFLSVLHKNYELHKINLLWAGRVSESRNLVAGQFKNLSSVLEHIKSELSAEVTDGIRLERRIAAALDRKGIAASHIRVIGSEPLEISMELPSCGGERNCVQKVAAVLGSVLQKPVMRMPAICGESTCRLQFKEQARYALETGFAQVAGKNGTICGDHYMLSPSADGKYVLALSDGMGQGGKAQSQSSMTIHLIRQLLLCGFDKETALRLINSILMISTEQESFATADLCLVNLYSGALEFIKIGASNSYFKKGDAVERITCSSLPAGIISNVEADCDLKFASVDDYVVLVTDGVTDVLGKGEHDTVESIIENFSGDAPQQLADEILRMAILAGGGVAKDDMTVLVARLTEI